MEKKIRPLIFRNRVVTENNQEVEISTIYDRFNSMYTNPDFLQRTQPTSNNALYMRRISLIEIFKNRVESILENIFDNINQKLQIYNKEKCEHRNNDLYLAKTNCGFIYSRDIIDELKEKYEFIFDLSFYANLNQKDKYPIIMDLAMVITTLIGNHLGSRMNFSNASTYTIENATNFIVDKILFELYKVLVNALLFINQEVWTVYNDAGYPNMELSESQSPRILSSGVEEIPDNINNNIQNGTCLGKENSEDNAQYANLLEFTPEQKEIFISNIADLIDHKNKGDKVSIYHF